MREIIEKKVKEYHNQLNAEIDEVRQAIADNSYLSERFESRLKTAQKDEAETNSEAVKDFLREFKQIIHFEHN